MCFKCFKDSRILFNWLRIVMLNAGGSRSDGVGLKKACGTLPVPSKNEEAQRAKAMFVLFLMFRYSILFIILIASTHHYQQLKSWQAHMYFHLYPGKSAINTLCLEPLQTRSLLKCSSSGKKHRCGTHMQLYGHAGPPIWNVCSCNAETKVQDLLRSKSSKNAFNICHLSTAFKNETNMQSYWRNKLASRALMNHRTSVDIKGILSDVFVCVQLFACYVPWWILHGSHESWSWQDLTIVLRLIAAQTTKDMLGTSLCTVIPSLLPYET